MYVSRGYRKHGFDAHGDRVLRKEHMDHWKKDSLLTDPQGVALGLSAEIQEVEPGFFGLLPTIRCVWMENPSCNLNLDGETAKLFRQNHVILRGVYDSAAEEQAREHKLRFLHLDVELYAGGDFTPHGWDVIAIRFREDGSVYLHQDSRCQGSSAGSVGGGELSQDLPVNFYQMMPPEVLAGKCWYSQVVLDNGILAAFMERARAKKGCLLDFSK